MPYFVGPRGSGAYIRGEIFRAFCRANVGTRDIVRYFRPQRFSLPSQTFQRYFRRTYRNRFLDIDVHQKNVESRKKEKILFGILSTERYSYLKCSANVFDLNLKIMVFGVKSSNNVDNAKKNVTKSFFFLFFHFRY